jgi:alpha-glucosidase
VLTASPDQPTCRQARHTDARRTDARPAGAASERWWRTGAVYQLYLRSFADSDGDGIGDLPGALARLDHLAELGVDAVWVNPWYPSPMRDGGYDITDHRDIDPRFGTLADAEAFIAGAHRRGLRVIVDVVPNHTSSDHPWFRAALAARPGSPERARYHFLDGRGPDGASPPNDWSSAFGGSAWERVPDGQWYLHLFDSGQPDLNWRNPDVRADFLDTLRFWLDRGVDGVRVDVAHGLAKDPIYPDNGGVAVPADRRDLVDHPYWDRDEVHELIREWRALVDGYDRRMMVAEAVVSPVRLPDYLAPDQYHQSFNFDLLEADWDAARFAEVIVTSHDGAAAVGATSTWVLSNHDVMRHATRYGLPPGTDHGRWPVTGPHEALDAATGLRRARAAALVTLALPGSVYLYQGDELGLPEVWDLPVEVLEDPTWRRTGGAMRGRDGCRVPLPWDDTGPSLGFGPAAAWLPQPAAFADLAVSRQAADPSSTLALHRRALRLRRELLVGDEAITMLPLGDHVLAFARGSGIVCVANMGAEPVALPDGQVLIASAPVTEGLLPRDAAVWLAPVTPAVTPAA